MANEKKLMKRIEKLENKLHNLEIMLIRYVKEPVESELSTEAVDEKTALDMFQNYEQNHTKEKIIST